MHPLQGGRRKEQVLVVMYWLMRYEEKATMTSGEIREGLKRARVPQWRTINVADVLNRSAPYVSVAGGSDGRLLWELTQTGQDEVRKLLGLPAAEPEVEQDVGSLEKLANSISDDNV